MIDKKFFSAKILLFGEYSIIRQSMALALPYPAYQGHLAWGNQTDSEILSFVEYLENLARQEETKQTPMPLNDYFDLPALKIAVQKNLFFQSAIPRGYGLGSSGALCAALYHQFGKILRHPLDVEQLTLAQIALLKSIFAQLESHFHGESSGIDPLISYLSTPLLIRDQYHLGPINIPPYDEGKGGLFLLNTGRSRKTGPLVKIFLDKCQDQRFNRTCQTVLLPITNGLINAFLERNVDTIFEFYRELSDFQYRHFSPMIPEDYQKLWREGLKKEHFYLKLCGSGGGGFLMGICRDFEAAEDYLANQSWEWFIRF